MTWIYFQTQDADVDCVICDDDGRLLARHPMSLEGARCRRSDFDAAIEEAHWNRDLAETLQALGVVE